MTVAAAAPTTILPSTRPEASPSRLGRAAPGPETACLVALQ
jgi:hypothetical protein